MIETIEQQVAAIKDLPIWKEIKLNSARSSEYLAQGHADLSRCLMNLDRVRRCEFAANESNADDSEWEQNG